MNKITQICLHHSGPPAGFNYTFEDINRYHRQKWNMVSSLEEFGGYTAAINPLGEMHQFRAIGEETIGARGHNFNTIHICLIGDFTKDKPTYEQRTKLKNVLVGLLLNGPESVSLKVIPGTLLDLKATRIYPHRYLQTDTQCYGNLPDDFGQQLIREHLTYLQQLLITIRTLYQNIVRLKNLGSSQVECNETR